MTRRRDPNSSEDKEPSSVDRWLVSYADFITLMFAFFAVLYATSVKDIEKQKQFQDSLKHYLIKAGAFGESGQQINQGQKNNSPIDSPIQTFNPTKPETAAVRDEAEAFMEAHLSKEDRRKYITDITADDWGVRIIIPASALFSGKSDKFQESAMPFVSKLSDLMAKTKRKILVEGHSSAGETGAYKSTWEFASARSVNMIRFIQQKEHMQSSQLASVTLGDSRPLYQNEKKALNSRLEVVILNPDYEL
jgi:chemotaxis protein MotB